MINMELLQKAILLTKQGKIQEAKDIYENLMLDNPEDSNLLSVFGLFHVNIGDYDKACELLRRACEINPSFGSVSALGIAEYERQNYLISAKVLEQALRLGQNVDVYDKLISSLFEIKQYKSAVEYSMKMYELYPEDMRSVACKVKALTQLGSLLEAEKLCVNTLKVNQNSASLWFHLGFLKELIYSDDNQAKACYKYALELGNDNAYYNIAVSCYKLGEYAEAEENYKKMLDCKPNDESTISSLGICYLAQRKFKEGYELFFKRDKSKYIDLSNNFWQPGENIDNEINIICDQGYGDNIQFIRYVSLLGDRKINIATRNVLTQLFKENYPNLNFVKYEELDKNIQTLFITDLAYALDLDFDNIPFAEGYLNVTPSEIKNDKVKVGFCWEAGSAGIRTMINRTINIKLFENMLNLDNIQIYSFQVDDTLKGNETYSQMINLAQDFNDFYDTAQALKAMDVVVTVDTAVAHLAGALGVKTYLLLPYATDWRWFSDVKTTPWYRNVEIFKQQDHISWEKTINNVVEKLKSF